jgi:type II secretion system (T2SS) protein G
MHNRFRVPLRQIRRPRALAPAVALAVAAALLVPLAGCARNPLEQLSDEAARKQAVEAVLANQAARQDILARLTGTPTDRAVVLERLLGDDTAKAEIVRKVIADDRGKALVVKEVTADDAGAKTFIRMLMTTGVMGTSLSQRQADALGYGEAYTFGNRRRTMSDMKKIGAAVDAFAHGHEGHYPVCARFGDITGCLAAALPKEALASLRTADAWGAPFQYHSAAESGAYELVSLATDGTWDGLGKVGPTDDVNCDIVFSNGNFVQWPGSLRLQDIP